MAERPILFSGPMVRAILEGRKTQTRRVIKCPRSTGAFVLVGMADETLWPHVSYDGEAIDDGNGCEVPMHCPYGVPGDHLWVRETWTSGYQNGCWGTICAADNSFIQGKRQHAKGPHFHAKEIGPHIKWRPSIFMPRWASRITLEITDVRVQRLEDISEEDAASEGASGGCLNCGEEPCAKDCFVHMPSYRDGFAHIWMKINGEESWHSNPWVWAISFKRVEASR